jgi:hypothetical protein
MPYFTWKLLNRMRIYLFLLQGKTISHTFSTGETCQALYKSTNLVDTQIKDMGYKCGRITFSSGLRMGRYKCAAWRIAKNGSSY